MNVFFETQPGYIILLMAIMKFDLGWTAKNYDLVFYSRTACIKVKYMGNWNTNVKTTTGEKDKKDTIKRTIRKMWEKKIDL